MVLGHGAQVWLQMGNGVGRVEVKILHARSLQQGNAPEACAYCSVLWWVLVVASSSVVKLIAFGMMQNGTRHEVQRKGCLTRHAWLIVRVKR